MLGADIDEVEEAGTAIRFGEEESGIGLGIRGLDPLKAGPNGAVIAAAFSKNPAAIAAHPHGHLLLLLREREREIVVRNWLDVLGSGEYLRAVVGHQVDIGISEVNAVVSK